MMRRGSLVDRSSCYKGSALFLAILASLAVLATIVLPCWVIVKGDNADESFGLLYSCTKWRNCSTVGDKLYNTEARDWWIPILVFECTGFLLTVACVFTVGTMIKHPDRCRTLKLLYVATSAPAVLLLIAAVMLPIAASNRHKQIIPGTEGITFGWGLIVAIFAAVLLVISLFFIGFLKPKEVPTMMSMPNISCVKGITSLKSSVSSAGSAYTATPYDSAPAEKGTEQEKPQGEVQEKVYQELEEYQKETTKDRMD